MLKNVNPIPNCHDTSRILCGDDGANVAYYLDISTTFFFIFFLLLYLLLSFANTNRKEEEKRKE